MRNLTTIFILSLSCLSMNGCSLITTTNPFANIDKLGTVIAPDRSVTIQSEVGPVTIEYAAPTRRRIIFNGEAREFKLSKNTQYMGVKAAVKFKQDPIKDIYGVSYGEDTLPFRSESELNKFLGQCDLFEHRLDDQMLVKCTVADHSIGFLKTGKWFYITIYKYLIVDPEKKITRRVYVY